MTTKKIITMLPFDEEFKLTLLREYDGLDEDRKYTIDEILWDTYDLFYEWKLQERMAIELDKSQKQNQFPDKNLYARIREETEKEMEESGIETNEKVDLTLTRQALDDIVHEKQ